MMKNTKVTIASAAIAAVSVCLFSSASFAEDLTSSLEFVDNPTYREWNSNITLTGIADLQFYRGKLFPGVGEVEKNPGPVPIYSIDPYTKLSVKVPGAKTVALGYTHRFTGAANYSVPLEDLGLKPGESFTLEFKWSDNRQSDDPMDFYVNGDAAPRGRMNWTFVYEAK